MVMAKLLFTIYIQNLNFISYPNFGRVDSELSKSLVEKYIILTRVVLKLPVVIETDEKQRA